MEPGSPWGVSEKLSESCKGNFAGAGSGSMGMRLDELANSSFLQEGKLEGDLRRRGKRRGSNKISSFLYVMENVGDPKGARQPFLGKA
jgi:hypothetical protein